MTDHRITDMGLAVGQFSQMIHNIQDYAVFMMDPEGRIHSWNQGAVNIEGYQEEEVLGRSFEIFFTQEDQARGEPAHELALAAANGTYVGEGWRRRKDGSSFWSSIDVTAIRDADGVLKGFVKISKDLTERRRTEERFRQVVESAPNAMVMVNARGRIEMVNTQAERVFGYARNEMLGQSVEMLVPDRFRHGHPEKRALFFSDPRSRPMGAGRDLFGRRKDGSEFPVEIGLNPIEADGETMVLSAIVDISDRKRMQERFRQVVESAPNAMVMINAQGRIEMVNTQAERLFGYARDEMLGQTVEMLVPDRFRHGHPEKRALFFSDPRSRPMGAGRDLFGRHKDGSEFPVEIGLNPIETDGETMVLSAIVDISDRKQKEARIQAALREKDLLLGEIHHRVKNNLQIVRSFIDLQIYRFQDKGIRDMLIETQNRVHSMSLIHQILYESKNFSEVDLGLFLNVLAPALVATYGLDAERVRLKIDVGEVFLPINAAIPCGLLVNELITNALKHGFPGDRRGEVSVSFSLLAQDQAMLRVSDDGVGISDDLDIQQTNTMGLSLVTLLSQQLMGRLEIHRRDPTCFTLIFPMPSAIEKALT
ncbi:PAS domain S-box protein [Azospirillum sp. B4]|uniref:PAS domain S-box protein n=1 Tax=Azospirillum sp. B4 TaxID=95605 RepID=UPI00034868EE|nr:PAS domain S-box protein [Azospirillum sp. B4]